MIILFPSQSEKGRLVNMQFAEHVQGANFVLIKLYLILNFTLDMQFIGLRQYKTLKLPLEY